MIIDELLDHCESKNRFYDYDSVAYICEEAEMFNFHYIVEAFNCGIGLFIKQALQTYVKENYPHCTNLLNHIAQARFEIVENTFIVN